MTEEKSITVKAVDDVTVINFNSPSMGALSGIEEVSAEINKFVAENKPAKIIVDFEGVKFFSSQALGMLIEIWRKIEKYQGKMVISGINPQLYRVFKITNLNKIFEFYENTDQAIASFNN